MKTNEAPKKIYLPYKDGRLIGIVKTEGVRFSSGVDGHIEYVRKDVFIEKACKWLRTHSEADYFELIPDANYCGAGNLNKKRMIDEFRKYMEGNRYDRQSTENP